MAEPAVAFHDVSLCYRAPTERGILTLKEWAIKRLTSSITYHEVRALSHVSFTVEHGSTFGIIGPNGAGKSSLLRVAGGILAPTEGEAVIRGRLAPIIELGTGFEFELSGRENIFFNGALLGRSRSEMEARFDEIVDFSGLADFVDVPIRTYSTGMVARLAFAIAVAVEANILLLDEILSVGDQDFRNKCLRRIEEFRQSGVTILFVSHDLNAIRYLCKQALWLDHGKVRAIGPADEVTNEYYATVVTQAPPELSAVSQGTAADELVEAAQSPGSAAASGSSGEAEGS